ncbi:hypothetical protein OPU39_12830, partial [Acinetobacter nosocomialis]|nr:hypothetical protein [Acinetobacter nosocomialis]
LTQIFNEYGCIVYRQIQQQEKLQTPTIADESQLKPMEP